MNTQDYDSYDDFVSACRALGLNQVALQAVNERRARVDGDIVDTSRVHRATLLAYNKPTLLKCVLKDEPPAKIQVMLMKAGFEVSRRDDKQT